MPVVKLKLSWYRKISPIEPSIKSLCVKEAVQNHSEVHTMIKKVSGGYKVLSEKGKSLGGPYKTRAEAEKRLKQVEYFKHRK
jgi:hypothetical protein